MLYCLLATGIWGVEINKYDNDSSVSVGGMLNIKALRAFIIATGHERVDTYHQHAHRHSQHVSRLLRDVEAY